MNNTMGDLKHFLFAQIERISGAGLSPEQIASEAKRADAIVALADQVVESTKLQLMSAKLFAELGDFPIVLTRCLDTARSWLRTQTRGERRCGLVASSGALRLRAHGLEFISA